MTLSVGPVGSQIIGHGVNPFRQPLFNVIDPFCQPIFDVIDTSRQPIFDIINPLPEIDIGEPDGCFYLFKTFIGFFTMTLHFPIQSVDTLNHNVELPADIFQHYRDQITVRHDELLRQSIRYASLCARCVFV
jgi:hypothetical protein